GRGGRRALRPSPARHARLLQLRFRGRDPPPARALGLRRRAGVAREQALRPARRPRVRALGGAHEAPRAPARAAPRRVRGRRPWQDGAAFDPGIRTTEHLREETRMNTPKIVLLPGDGIGPEIVGAARRVLDAVGEFEYEEHLIGGAAIDAHGTALTDEVLDACRAADAVLLGAVGGPKWDTTDPDKPRPEQGLLGLRKGLGLYANLRPVRPSPAL